MFVFILCFDFDSNAHECIHCTIILWPLFRVCCFNGLCILCIRTRNCQNLRITICLLSSYCNVNMLAICGDSWGRDDKGEVGVIL